ncbi:hypothetical protein ACQJBY_026601 [Aegilops geniculata]
MASDALASPFAPLTNQPQQQQPSHEHPAAPPPKKKRNLPGTPDPDAEVIALSPRTLMATNRFVCEICGKGFQRDQNLQLHRRGHNLPWKLRQRSGKEPRKRVYVCPEKSCVHHNPSRALGDLTGIKKHFCRKHGEKKWKCECATSAPSATPCSPTGRPTPRPAARASTAATAAPSSPGGTASSRTAPSATRSPRRPPGSRPPLRSPRRRPRLPCAAAGRDTSSPGRTA